jgi:hypothetical protein
MTAKSDFTADEWETVLKGPPAAGLMIASAQRGGSFRESYSIAKAYTDARQEHGASQLLDDIVGEKPKMERPHVHSVEEIKQSSLDQLKQSVTLLEQKATGDEVDQYKRFVVDLAARVGAPRGFSRLQRRPRLRCRAAGRHGRGRRARRPGAGPVM